MNVVWLAAEFRPEHRAALDWLNQRTDVETRFFGVEVAAVRIGDSLPAPLFQVVAKPNDWGKQVRTRAQADEGGASERSMRYAEFWQRFLETVHGQEPSWTNASIAPAQNWFNLPTGSSRMVFGLSFGRRGLFSSLYLEHPDAEVNLARFRWLQARRGTLDDIYGAPLDYDEKSGRKATAIGDVKDDAEISMVGEWDGYIAWLMGSQRRLRHALQEIGGIRTLSDVTGP